MGGEGGLMRRGLMVRRGFGGENFGVVGFGVECWDESSMDVVNMRYCLSAC